MLIYDCEIKKAILGNGELPIQHIEYCAGWHDHANMGISCICAYDYEEDRYRVFLEDNFREFQAMVDRHQIIVGFNSISFDNRLCACNGLNVPDEKSYDILRELWIAAGLAPTFRYPTHVGFGLDATCAANFDVRKTGSGAMAPVDWQRKKFGSVIDYCLNDVMMTKRLLDIIVCDDGKVFDPRNPDKTLILRDPVCVLSKEGVSCQ